MLQTLNFFNVYLLFREAELSEHPDAVLQAVQFFMSSKKQQGPTNKLPYKIPHTIQKESHDNEGLG